MLDYKDAGIHKRLNTHVMKKTRLDDDGYVTEVIMQTWGGREILGEETLMKDGCWRRWWCVQRWKEWRRLMASFANFVSDWPQYGKKTRHTFLTRPGRDYSQQAINHTKKTKQIFVTHKNNSLLNLLMDWYDDDDDLNGWKLKMSQEQESWVETKFFFFIFRHLVVVMSAGYTHNLLLTSPTLPTTTTLP